jgi:hypothetical protein
MTDITKPVALSIAARKPASELDKAQLFAHAENSLSVALFHLRQPAATVPGAARKAVQALAALNQLRGLVDGCGSMAATVEG